MRRVYTSAAIRTTRAARARRRFAGGGGAARACPPRSRMKARIGLQAVAVAPRVLHVALRGAQEVLGLVGVEGADHLPRRAHDDRVVGDLLTFGDEGLGADDAASAD